MEDAEMNRIIERVNEFNDHRNRPGAKLVIEIDEVEHRLPWKWEVCSVCNGEGKHVAAGVDSSGLSAEDFAEDPDFAEAYFDGAYDVECSRCKGRSTEKVIDWEKVPAELREAIEAEERAESDYRAMVLAEIRAGC
jgi:hypothetical protein